MRMNERRTKMSPVKRKLTNKTLVQKCEIIRHIEKGMTNKEASERFGVLENTISTWIKIRINFWLHYKKPRRIHKSYVAVITLKEETFAERNFRG